MTNAGRFACVSAGARMLVFAGLVAVASLAGCSSDKVFRAANLPPMLHAPPVENAQTIDLSKLAMSAPANDQIDRGDVIEITISAGLSLEDTISFPTRVSDNGSAELPDIGVVPLAGLNLEEAEAAIVSACVNRGLYRRPNVTVTMKRQRMNRVTVLGGVSRPGTYSLPRGSSDLLAALVAAGSLSKDAGINVEIHHPGALGIDRGGRSPAPIAEGANGVSPVGHSARTGGSRARPKTLRVNLASAVQAGTDGYYIDDGGIVMVEKRVPQPIHVLGLVKTPNKYEYPVTEEIRVLEAIALAGGVSNPVADKIYIIRKKPSIAEPALIETSISEAKRNGHADLRLQPGDIVSVEQTPSTVVMDAIRLLNFGIGASLGTIF
jgi:polysaccharide biosynthesis/export protein